GALTPLGARDALALLLRGRSGGRGRLGRGGFCFHVGCRLGLRDGLVDGNRLLGRERRFGRFNRFLGRRLFLGDGSLLGNDRCGSLFRLGLSRNLFGLNGSLGYRLRLRSDFGLGDELRRSFRGWLFRLLLSRPLRRRLVGLAEGVRRRLFRRTDGVRRG